MVPAPWAAGFGGRIWRIRRKFPEDYRDPLKHLLALADQLRERGADLVVLKQQIDTTTPTGRLVFHVLGALDEFQRELIIEGTREGLTPPAPAAAPEASSPN